MPRASSPARSSSPISGKIPRGMTKGVVRNMNPDHSGERFRENSFGHTDFFYILKSDTDGRESDQRAGCQTVNPASGSNDKTSNR